MGKNALLFILSFLYNLAVSQQRIDISFQLEGRKRESIIVIPSAPPPKDGYAIVVMLHGTSGNGEKFFNISGWKELGEEKGFITVFPSSLSWCWSEDGIEMRNERWVTGSVTGSPCSQPQDYVDDVKFLKLLIQKISDTLPINPCKVYASGFSNGCAMTSKLAVEAGDIFTAITGSGSFLASEDSSKSIKRVPIWIMMGTEDEKFTRENFPSIPFGEDSSIIYFQNALNRTRAVQGLTDIFEKKENENYKTYTWSQCITGENCQPLSFTIIKGMTHQYPNGNNFPVSAPELFWEFSENACQAINSIHTIKNQEQIEIFPNPSHDLMKIQSPNSFPSDIKVFSMDGKLVYNKSNTENTIILKKSEIGEGMFLIVFYINNKVQFKKIIFY